MAVVMAKNDPTSTEMNPMYATIQDHPPTSQSPLPCDVSKTDTATSETALLNPYDRPERPVTARSGYPSARLDTDNAIYGKGPAEEKEKKVVRFDSDEYLSKERLWSFVQSCSFLVLPVVACVFAAAVFIVTLLLAFGVVRVTGGEQSAAAEQLASLNMTLASLNMTLARLEAELENITMQDSAPACPNSTSPPLPASSSLYLHTVNFSTCVPYTSSCNFNKTTPCTTGPNSTSPEFLEERRNSTSVTVELSCWVSAAGVQASAVFLFANSTLFCQCSGSLGGAGAGEAVCNFYRMECQVPVVEVVQSQP